MRKELKYPVIAEYPKGDTRHYDIENPMPIVDTRVAIEEEE